MFKVIAHRREFFYGGGGHVVTISFEKITSRSFCSSEKVNCILSPEILTLITWGREGGLKSISFFLLHNIVMVPNLIFNLELQILTFRIRFLDSGSRDIVENIHPFFRREAPRKIWSPP